MGLIHAQEGLWNQSQMSAGKTHVIYHVAWLEPSPRPTETMTLVMVLDKGGSGDTLLFCLDDDELGGLCGAQAVIGPALATVYYKTQVPPTLQILLEPRATQRKASDPQACHCKPICCSYTTYLPLRFPVSLPYFLCFIPPFSSFLCVP